MTKGKVNEIKPAMRYYLTSVRVAVKKIRDKCCRNIEIREYLYTAVAM